MLSKSHKLLNIGGGGIRTFGPLELRTAENKSGMVDENNVVFLNC